MSLAKLAPMASVCVCVKWSIRRARSVQVIPNLTANHRSRLIQTNGWICNFLDRRKIRLFHTITNKQVGVIIMMMIHLPGTHEVR